MRNISNLVLPSLASLGPSFPGFTWYSICLCLVHFLLRSFHLSFSYIAKEFKTFVTIGKGGIGC
ncbi:hypothetical protein GYH30_015981 [Glycine max]|uniref:Uncharacterized protein n=2 Tax=Glycine subgen. Soja TaxID=1462606 RepID=A0A0R0JKF8_SOYBN|nr:hypothetical protein GYH30_015981 [Glycine max]RZC08808.1 hypothetical protein D0Y65_015490 [Glycine soja]